MAEEHLISIESHNNSQPIGYAKEIVYSSFHNFPLLMSGYCYTSTSGQLKASKNDTVGKDFRFRGADSSIYLSLADYMLRVLKFKVTKIKDTDMSNVFWYFKTPAMKKNDRNIFNAFVPNQDSSVNKSVIYIPLDHIKPLLSEYMSKKYSYGHPSMSSLLQNNGCLSELIPYLKKSSEIQDKIYNIIKKTTKTPFVKEWLPYVLEQTEAIEFKLSLALYSDWDDPNNMYAFVVIIYNPSLRSKVSSALSQGLIKINNSNMVSNTFDNIATLTDYLKHFSGKLIDKTANYFNPIFDPNTETFTQKEKDYYDFTGYSSKLKFFDAQKNVIGAVSRSLKKNKAALIVGEMGCGKTALSIASTYINCKKPNPTNIVMCPGHLVEKWKREVERLYPGAKAVIISDFNTLQQLDKEILNTKRPHPLFMIISKDIAKIDYITRPSIIYNKARHTFICPECGCEYASPIVFNNLKTEDGNIVFAKNRTSMHVNYSNLGSWKAFLTPSKNNSICTTLNENKRFSNKRIKRLNTSAKKNRTRYSYYSCGCQLWSATNSQEKTPWKKYPGVGYIHNDMIEDIKATYNNKSIMDKLSTPNKTLVQKLYKAIIADEEIGVKKVAPRRYSIAKYIHNKYKNKIDYFIADEVHMYSSSSSAQANAFGDFVLTAKKTIALTGTLLNGYADGIYYILYRMFPKAFQEYGYTYESITPFVSEFGVQQIIEKITQSTYYRKRDNVSKTTKTCPGVSPKLFTQFLLDKAIFISLSDMSTGLPKYSEIPVPIEMDYEIRSKYREITASIRNYFSTERDRSKSFAVAFTAARKLSLYPDQPYNNTPIVDPDNYSNAMINFPDAISKEQIKIYYSPKDLKVLELTQEKIEKGENVLIYLDYVNKTDCIDRLEKMFKRANIKSCTLIASIPAKDREEWIDTKVREGCRVMICNPRLVETGLDLLKSPRALMTLAVK